MIRTGHRPSLGLSPWAAFPDKLSPSHAADFVCSLNKGSGMKSGRAGPAPLGPSSSRNNAGVPRAS